MLKRLTRLVCRRVYANSFRCIGFKRTQTQHELELQAEESITHVSFENSLISLFNKLEKEPHRTHNIFKQSFGFIPTIIESTIPEAGLGVFLEGKTERNQIVGIYPGLIYEQEDPALWCSLRNDYFLRRCDGSSVDGKYFGLSKWLFNSIAKRNQIYDGNELVEICDENWLAISYLARKNPSKQETIIQMKNPLNSGQLINCASDGNKANVMYYEYDFTIDFPIHLRKYIPNVSYNSNQKGDLLVKSILMISLRDIENEELFSDYSFIGTNNL